MDNRSDATNMSIIMLGDTTVGKTAIIEALLGSEFRNLALATIGIDFKIKIMNIDDHLIKLKIWDTAGQERYKAISKSYIRNVEGCILVFDLTRLETLENISNWIKTIREIETFNLPIVLVGNKSDLKENRVVTQDRIQQYCVTYNLQYYELSAKTKTNINEPFIGIGREIIRNKKVPVLSDSVIILTDKSESKCCK